MAIWAVCTKTIEKLEEINTALTYSSQWASGWFRSSLKGDSTGSKQGEQALIKNLQQSEAKGDLPSEWMLLVGQHVRSSVRKQMVKPVGSTLTCSEVSQSYTQRTVQKRNAVLSVHCTTAVSYTLLLKQCIHSPKEFSSLRSKTSQECVKTGVSISPGYNLSPTEVKNIWEWCNKR